MKRTRVALCVLVCACVSSLLAQDTAAPQSSRESVMKFFEVANVERQVQQMQEVMVTQATNSAKAILDNNPKLTPEQREEALARIAPEMEAFRTLYPVSEMLQDMAPVYQKHFSESDLQSIIVFLQSPVGQKMLNETPRMMQESMAIIMPKLNARMQAQVDALQKRIESGMNDQKATPGSKPSPKKN